MTIKGESKAEQEVKKEDYLYQERRYGAFSRSVVLPGGLKPDKAEATMEDGVLTLTMPKAEEVKPKKLASKLKRRLKRRNDYFRAPLSDFSKSMNCLKILAVAPHMICPSYSYS